MCAIMGVLDRKAPVNIDIMQSMQRILQHRGPDDSGIEMLDMAWPSSKSYPYIGVAFDRLSIRDLSMAGHQPMWDEKREVMVIMNGEVYNTGELTEDLQQRNIKLHSNSDVEVLLNVYLVYGIEEALRKLDGMFAICLIDKRQQKIYLVRDRIGEKPLYLYEDNDRLMFASEYKAFYCHPEFRAELNRDLVSEYFLFRFSLSGETFLKGVRNMRPGSYLEISSNGVKERVYWQLPRPVKANRTFKQSKDELKRLIIQSTKRRLISDRAIGMQLSGGVDSSYLCWVVKNELQEDLDSYSIGFEDENCDESKYVDIVNRRLNLKSHKIVYRPKDFLASWEEATWYFEAPMNHEGTLALLQLNRMASKNVTVMLCGDGPDECMGGYSRFHRVDRYLRRRHGITWMANKWIELRKGNSHYRSLDDYFISQSQYMSDEAFRQLFPETYKCEMRNVYRRRKKLLPSLIKEKECVDI